MLDYLAMTLVCLGYIDQGRSRMDEALSEARRLRHAHTLAYVLTHQHWTYWLIGSSTAPIEELLILTTEHGFPHYLSWALALRGWSLTALGQAQDGVALVAQGLEGFGYR